MAGGIARFARKPVTPITANSTDSASVDDDLPNAEVGTGNKEPLATSVPPAEYDFFSSNDDFPSNTVNAEATYTEWESFDHDINMHGNNNDFNSFDEDNVGSFIFDEFAESESKTVPPELHYPIQPVEGEKSTGISMFKNRSLPTSQQPPNGKCEVNIHAAGDIVSTEPTYGGSNVTATNSMHRDTSHSDGEKLCDATATSKELLKSDSQQEGTSKEESLYTLQDCHKDDSLAPSSGVTLSATVADGSQQNFEHSTGLDANSIEVSKKQFVDPPSNQPAPLTPSTAPNRKVAHFKTPTARRRDALPGIMAVQTRSPFSGGRVLPLGTSNRSRLGGEDRGTKHLITPVSYINSLNSSIANNEMEAIEEKQFLLQDSDDMGNDEKNRGTGPDISSTSDFEKNKDNAESGIGEMEQFELPATITPNQNFCGASKFENRNSSADLNGDTNHLAAAENIFESPVLKTATTKSRERETSDHTGTLLNTGMGLHGSGINYPNRRSHANVFKTPSSIATPPPITQKVTMQTSNVNKSLTQQQQNRKPTFPQDIDKDHAMACDAGEPSNIFDDEYQVFLDKLRDYSEKEQLFNNSLIDMTVALSMQQTNLLEVEADMMDLTTELESLLQSTSESMERFL